MFSLAHQSWFSFCSMSVKKVVMHFTNNESWTSFCYLYHKYDSTVLSRQCYFWSSFLDTEISKTATSHKAWTRDILRCSASSDWRMDYCFRMRESRHQPLGRNMIPLHFEFVPYTSFMMITYNLLRFGLVTSFISTKWRFGFYSLWFIMGSLVVSPLTTLRSKHRP